jgi:hypothetical protein
VLLATGFAVVGMMIAMQLYVWQLWPDPSWTFLIVPAAFSSVYLALRHPGTSLLTTLIFFPLLVMFLFYAGACLPLEPVAR